MTNHFRRQKIRELRDINRELKERERVRENIRNEKTQIKKLKKEIFRRRTSGISRLLGIENRERTKITTRRAPVRRTSRPRQRVIIREREPREIIEEIFERREPVRRTSRPRQRVIIRERFKRSAPVRSAPVRSKTVKKKPKKKDLLAGLDDLFRF